MSEQLSPAAQAVWTAYEQAECDPYLIDPRRAELAAALCAAADQVLPELQEPDWGVCDQMSCDIELYTDHQRKRSALLAIAAEFASTQPSSENV